MGWRRSAAKALLRMEAGWYVVAGRCHQRKHHKVPRFVRSSCGSQVHKTVHRVMCVRRRSSLLRIGASHSLHATAIVCEVFAVGDRIRCMAVAKTSHLVSTQLQWHGHTNLNLGFSVTSSSRATRTKGPRSTCTPKRLLCKAWMQFFRGNTHPSDTLKGPP